MLLKKHHILRSSQKYLFIASPLLMFVIVVICLKKSTVFQERKFNLKTKQTNKHFLEFPVVTEFEVRSRKKFDNEEARHIGFPITKDDKSALKTNNSPAIIYLATKYFNEWNPRHYYFLHLGNETFTRYPCAINNCYATNNPSDLYRSHAIIFHVRDIEIFNIPSFRLPQQIWILYSMEPPWLEIQDMRRFDGIFNWTMSYRRGSDLLMKYGFIGLEKHPKQLSKNSLGNLFDQKSNAAVWYVSDCQTDSNREEYIMRLKKAYPVDVIGGCGTEGCRPAETKKCYIRIAKRYKFYLAFENALCQDYVTEKLFNPLEYYIIPVTFGGANYSNITPENSIINAMDFASPEKLGEYLWKVSQNKSFYLSFFKWKRIYRSYLQPWMCDLCEKLHAPVVQPKTVHDLDSWWNENQSCKRWTTEGFNPVTNHRFPVFNTKLF